MIINFFSYEQLKKEGLIKNRPRVLDMGSGEGVYLKPFIQETTDITLVDKDDSQNEWALHNHLNVIKSDIRDFVPEGRYDVIFVRNVLSFLSSKKEIRDIIVRMYGALNPSGILCVTVFGEFDEWKIGRPHMTFLNKKEFLDEVLPCFPYIMNEREGNGLTKVGNKKYWHIFEAILRKESRGAK